MSECELTTSCTETTFSERGTVFGVFKNIFVAASRHAAFSCPAKSEVYFASKRLNSQLLLWKTVMKSSDFLRLCYLSSVFRVRVGSVKSSVPVPVLLHTVKRRTHAPTINRKLR